MQAKVEAILILTMRLQDQIGLQSGAPCFHREASLHRLEPLRLPVVQVPLVCESHDTLVSRSADHFFGRLAINNALAFRQQICPMLVFAVTDLQERLSR